MKSIQIAPSKEEVFFNESNSTIYTNFAGGITYQAERMFDIYTRDYLCECFQTGIALCSKREQLEWLMNKQLNLQGIIL